jgi:hypothetical protein
MEVSSRRSRGASKILPQFADFVANRGEGIFEVGKHFLILVHRGKTILQVGLRI